MTAIKYGELVRVVPKAFGLFPTEFTWRGRRHRVRRVERFDTETMPRLNGVSRSRLFHLQTTSGMRCLLSQDIERETWHLEKVLIGRGGVR